MDQLNYAIDSSFFFRKSKIWIFGLVLAWNEDWELIYVLVGEVVIWLVYLVVYLYLVNGLNSSYVTLEKEYVRDC